MDETLRPIPIGSWEVLREGHDGAILTFGTTIPMALEAAEHIIYKRDSCESCQCKIHQTT